MEKLDNRSGGGIESRSSSSLNSHPMGKFIPKLKWELASDSNNAHNHPN